jgi:hypothetical protein
MFAFGLVALFVLVAVVSLLGWTADSRELRPRLPLQAPRQRPEPLLAESVAATALPSRGRIRLHAR